MVEFLFIRHGEPDYTEIDKRKYKGFGNDLATLTKEGIRQVEKLTKDNNLKDADIIITSPYTRTMQTASILSKELNINMSVELDLMEWIPDLSYSYDDYSKVVKWRKQYDINNGKHINASYNWEEKESIQKRVKNVLKKYSNYSKVIVVTHGMVINALTNVEKPEYAKIIKYSYNP